MTSLAFTIYGLPAPQGSKRHVGKGILIEDNPRTKTWREDVKQAALLALNAHGTWDPAVPVVSLSVVFVFPRPKSHYRTGKLADQLRLDAPTLHTVKPDLDKLLRSTGDALTAAGVYRDDCRVAHVIATKLYAQPNASGSSGVPGARITISDGPFRRREP